MGARTATEQMVHARMFQARTPVKESTCCAGWATYLPTLWGSWTSTTRTLINATGTWDRPYWPYYPGRETFSGRQLHTHDYRSAEDFRGQHERRSIASATPV